MALALAIFLAWFVPWYLQRNEYISWPVVDVFKTVGLGMASVILVFIWIYVRGRSMKWENQTPKNQNPN
jgi:hypothetical protein